MNCKLKDKTRIDTMLVLLHYLRPITKKAVHMIHIERRDTIQMVCVEGAALINMFHLYLSVQKYYQRFTMAYITLPPWISVLFACVSIIVKSEHVMKKSIILFLFLFILVMIILSE